MNTRTMDVPMARPTTRIATGYASCAISNLSPVPTRKGKWCRSPCWQRCNRWKRGRDGPGNKSFGAATAHKNRRDNGPHFRGGPTRQIRSRDADTEAKMAVAGLPVAHWVLNVRKVLRRSNEDALSDREVGRPALRRKLAQWAESSPELQFCRAPSDDVILDPSP